MNATVRASLALAVTFAAGCAGKPETPATAAPAAPLAVDEAVTTRARAALAPFKASLRQALTEALAHGGPVEAIDVCASRAPALAAEASHDGVTVGRASTRLRNPSNRAPIWVEPLLADMHAAPDSAPRTIELGGGRVGYVEPIRVQPMCLACHGSELAPGVADALARRYPDDRARGYASGDFRGVYWVEVAESRQP